jgi:hypothetical protein
MGIPEHRHTIKKMYREIPPVLFRSIARFCALSSQICVSGARGVEIRRVADYVISVCTQISQIIKTCLSTDYTDYKELFIHRLHGLKNLLSTDYAD